MFGNKKSQRKPGKKGGIFAALSPSAKEQVIAQIGYNPEAPNKKTGGPKYRVSAPEERTVDGVVFDSKLESKIWHVLRSYLGDERVQRQVEFELIPKQTGPSGKKHQAMKYVCDFLVDGKYVIDAKGMRTQIYIMKYKLMLHVHKVEIIELKTENDAHDWYVRTFSP